MSNKNFELKLTPQNDEWIKLIPNPTQNMDIIFNKLIDSAISEGLFLETISQSLTLADLAKFKISYARMQSKRAEHMADLEITPTHTERKKVVQTHTVEVEREEIIPEEIPTPQTESRAIQKKDKKISHGFDEQVF